MNTLYITKCNVQSSAFLYKYTGCSKNSVVFNDKTNHLQVYRVFIFLWPCCHAHRDGTRKKFRHV